MSILNVLCELGNAQYSSNSSRTAANDLCELTWNFRCLWNTHHFDRKYAVEI